MAQYFFAWWSLASERPPDFRSRRSWYRTKLLVAHAGKEDEQLSYLAQYEAMWRAFAAAGIHSVKKTHVMHGCGIRSGELHGVDKEQVSSFHFVYSILSILTNTSLAVVRQPVGHQDDGGGLPLPSPEKVPAVGHRVHQ